MRIEVLRARTSITPDLEEELSKIRIPDENGLRLARSKNHAIGVKFFRDGLLDLRQISKIASDRKIRHEMYPGAGGYVLLKANEQAWFDVAYAGTIFGLGMRAIERILCEKVYNPILVRRDWYNTPLKNTLISKFAMDKETQEEYLRRHPKNFVVSEMLWKRMVEQSRKNPNHSGFFREGFNTLPPDLRDIVTPHLQGIKTHILPAFDRLADPKLSLPEPQIQVTDDHWANLLSSMGKLPPQASAS